jgi:hypothetical protein
MTAQVSRPFSAFAKLAQMARGTKPAPDGTSGEPNAKDTKPDAPDDYKEDDKKRPEDMDDDDDTDDDKKKKKKDGDTDDTDADVDDEEARVRAEAIIRAGQVRRGEVVQTFRQHRQPAGVKATSDAILAAGRKARGEK